MQGVRVNHGQWLATLDSDAFDVQTAAAETLLSIHQALANDGLSILHELLREQGERPIKAWAHYPADDCIDPATGAMFYYHAHDAREWDRKEHGHFHLFIRPRPEAAFCHLMAISMTDQGLPIALFTTNRWVTDETPLPAAELLPLVETQWEIARARPSWMLSQWLNALVSLLRPHLEALLAARDRTAGLDGGQGPAPIAPDDRRIHILSEQEIDLPEMLAAVQHELLSRTGQEPTPAATAAATRHRDALRV